MTSRIDVIGQNGNDGLAYLADVGDEQQHVSSSQAEINHIGEHNKMVGVKLDEHKARFDLIPPMAELAVAHVLRFGAEKYAPGNWALVENGHERYMAAALRHLNAYRMGELEDIESGYSPLAHAICCLLFILEKDECAEFTKLTEVE
jgi:hypothetical protein